MNSLLLAGLNNAAWAAALALVVAVVARFGSRRPALIHALWLLVLLKLVTPSLIRIETGRWIADPQPGLSITALIAEESSRVGGRGRASAMPPDADAFAPAGIADAPRRGSHNPPETADRRSHKRPADASGWEWPWQSIIIAVWLTGSMLWASSIVLGILRFRRLYRSAQPAPDELRRKVESIAKTLDLRRIPTTVIVPACVPPMLWALVGRPKLILPQTLWERLNDDERDAILAHELAHLKRRDEWARRLEAIALGLYWWNPVAWWARREVERTEEQCCDAWVLWALPGAASAYAQALVRTAEFLSDSKSRHPWPAGASGAGHFPPLKRRLSMILEAEAAVSIPKPRKVPRALAALAFLGLLALPAWAFSEPQKPETAKGGLIATALRSLPRQAADAVVAPKSIAKAPILDAPPEIADKVKFAQVVSGETQDSLLFQGVLEVAQAIEVPAPLRGLFKSLQKTGDFVEKEAPIFRYFATDRSEQSPGTQIPFNAEEKLAFEKTGLLIRSPVSGKIYPSSIFSNGQDTRIVRADKQLASITPTDSLLIDFRIPQAIFLKIKREKLKTGKPSALDVGYPVEVIVGGDTNWLSGKILSLDSKFDTKTGTLLCRASLPNPDNLFIPGMSATVKIATSDPRKALLIPQGVVRQDSDDRVVWVVNEQDIVVKRQITIVDAPDNRFEVTSGLKEGEWFVLAGHDRLKPRMKVKR